MKIERNKTRRPLAPPDFSRPEKILEGLIVAHHGVAVQVLLDEGERRMVRVKRNSGHVVGDSVVIFDEVMKRLPRSTELRRRDARGAIHLVAANLDVLGVVVTLNSPSGFLDRAIVAARSAELIPFVVVNKCDLDGTSELLSYVNATYAESVPVFPVSCTQRTGLSQLHQFFSEGHRGAFVGSTGVGKSSLLNTLCPEIDLKVGELSDYKGQGRHTTTVSTLHSLSGGGELVDTPGFRDFGLVDISVEDLAAHFPGFEKHSASACRFSNCRHRSEPGCAVIKLLHDGCITSERYEAYMEILGEIEVDQTESRSRGWKN